MGWFSAIGAAIGGAVGAVFGAGVGALVGAAIGGGLGAMIDGFLTNAEIERERQYQRELIREYHSLRDQHAGAEASKVQAFYKALVETAERRLEQTRRQIDALKKLRRTMLDDAKSRELRRTLFLDRDLLQRNIASVEGQIDNLFAFDQYLREYLNQVRPKAASASADDQLMAPPALVLPEEYPATGKLLGVTAEDLVRGYVENEWCGRINLIETEDVPDLQADEDGFYLARVSGHRAPVTASLARGQFLRLKREGRPVTVRVTSVEYPGLKVQWGELVDLSLWLPKGELQPLNLRVIPRMLLSVRVKHLEWGLRGSTVTMKTVDPQAAGQHSNDPIYILAGPDLSKEEQEQIEAVVQSAKTARILPLAEVEQVAAATMAPVAADPAITALEAATLGLNPDYLVVDFGQVSLVCELLDQWLCLRVVRLGPGAPQTAATIERQWGFCSKMPTLAQEEREAFLRFYYELQDSRERVRQAAGVTEEGKERAFQGADYLEAVERLMSQENQVTLLYEDVVQEGKGERLSGVTFAPPLKVRPEALSSATLTLADGTAIGKIERAWTDEAEPLALAEGQQGEAEEDEPSSPEGLLSGVMIRLNGEQPLPASGELFLNLQPTSAHVTRQRWAMDVLRRGYYVHPRLLGLLFAPESAGLSSRRLPPEQEALVRERLADRPSGVVERTLELLAAQDLALVMGPPGTGKTTLSVALIRAQLALKPSSRIAICSQSHYAVDELFARLAEWIPTHRLMRIGRAEKVAGIAQPFLPEQHLASYYERLAEAPIETVRIGRLRAEWQERIAAAPDYLQGLLVEHATVVGATTSALGGARNTLRHQEWDLVLVDEAGRLTLSELLVALVRAKRIVMVGDHRQLPPVVDQRLLSGGPENPWLSMRESQFEWLWRRYPQSHKFFNSKQFRMPPAVGDLLRSHFYPEADEQLENGRGEHPHDLNPPIRFWDVRGQQKPGGTSWLNQAEIEAAIEALREVRSWMEEIATPDSKHGRTVVFLTPYAAQRKAAAEAFSRQSDLLPAGWTADFRSVMEYQGHEADLVLLSLVRTAGKGHWVQDRQSLNVSLSRSMRGLILFGDRSYWERQQDPEPLIARLFAYGELHPHVIEIRQTGRSS